jgi:hypothetical protein
MKRVLLVAMAALALATAPASANVVFDLSNVTLSDGGDMTGSITLANNLASIVDLSITVSADAALGYQQITYVDTDTVSFQLPLNGFIRVDDASGDEMQLAFSQITALGGVPSFFLNDSYDHQPTGGNRLVTGGSLIPAPLSSLATTPLPATWTVMLIGLVGLGFMSYRRQKHATAFSAA